MRALVTVGLAVGVLAIVFASKLYGGRLRDRLGGTSPDEDAVMSEDIHRYVGEGGRSAAAGVE